MLNDPGYAKSYAERKALRVCGGGAHFPSMLRTRRSIPVKPGLAFHAACSLNMLESSLSFTADVKLVCNMVAIIQALLKTYTLLLNNVICAPLEFNTAILDGLIIVSTGAIAP